MGPLCVCSIRSVLWHGSLRNNGVEKAILYCTESDLLMVIWILHVDFDLGSLSNVRSSYLVTYDIRHIYDYLVTTHLDNCWHICWILLNILIYDMWLTIFEILHTVFLPRTSQRASSTEGSKSEGSM